MVNSPEKDNKVRTSKGSIHSRKSSKKSIKVNKSGGGEVAKPLNISVTQQVAVGATSNF